MSQMLTGVFLIAISSHTLHLVGSLALHGGSQGWNHCRIPDTQWGITSGMGILSHPPRSHQFSPIRTGGVIGIHPLTGVLPVDTSSHILELMMSLVWRPGGDLPPGHQTEVNDPLVTATHVPSATMGGHNALPWIRQGWWVGDTAA